MALDPKDLTELRQASVTKPSWFLDLSLPEVGGGRFDPAALDVIDSRPAATALRVSGLDQAGLERLVTDHGARLSAIELWKCPRIADLTPLEDLADLQMVSIYWNQRTSRLWNLSRTPLLCALRVEDVRRLHRLDDLQGGHALRELRLGDAVVGTSTFETLDPLARLTELQDLECLPKRIDDGRVQPLAALTGLTSLSLPANLFTTDQFAWLRARLGDAVESDVLEGVVTVPRRSVDELASSYVQLVGRRKPLLDSVSDAARIRKHAESFDALVTRFRADPTLPPS